MKPPYVICESLRPFDPQLNAFRRARSDSASAAYSARHRSREEAIAEGRKGMGRLDFALHTGAWAMSPKRYREEIPPEQLDDPEAAEPARKVRFEPEEWDAFTSELKDAAAFYGASLVGVTRVNPLWVYSTDGQSLLPEDLDTAIVMAVEMDHDLIATSPGAGASAATGMGYSKMAFVAKCIAAFLDDLGWRSYPCGNDTALSIPLAVDAGMGEVGRNGMLITRRLGPRVRLCKVFTDAPLTADAPVTLGVAKVCGTCRRCVDACEAGAVPAGERTMEGPTPSNNPGALKWYVDPDKCLAFWRKNGCNCSNCIAACPFNKPSGNRVLNEGR